MAVPAAWGLNAFWTAVANSAISYGISTVTNKLLVKKQKSTYQNSQTECNSNNVMPMVYGRVRCGGNVIWNSTGNSKYVYRAVSFGDGPISGISGVCFSDILVNSGPIMQIKNTLYSDATIRIYRTDSPSSYDKLLVLYANGTTTNIILSDTEVGTDGIQDFNNNVADLMPHISNLGYGWVANSVTGSSTSNSCQNLWDVATTSCYNSYVDLSVSGLSGCSYTAYTGTGAQTIDSRITGSSQTDKAKIVGGMKHEAYIACTAKLSSSLSGTFNITAIVDGRLVRIYSDPTTYTIAYSNNPAWCILDYMMAYNGCYVPFAEMNIQSFITAAAYFDVVVNGYPRFSLNMSIDSKKSHQEWITEMLKTCRSWLTYLNGKYGIMVEKAESVSQVFTLDPDEQWETWWNDLADEIDIAKVKYTDPGYEWVAVAAQARRDTIDRSPAQEKIIDITGITVFEQASAMAWFALNQEVDCPQWATWHANKRVINRTIGDVIQITDPVGMTKKWRIMTIKGTNRKELTMREYNENLYSDTLGGVKPIATITKMTNPLAAPPDITNVVLYQDYYKHGDGTIVSTLTGSCTLPSYVHFSAALVDYSIDNGVTWVDSGQTDDIGGFVLNNVKTLATYIIRVRVKNKMQVISAGVESDPIFITGKDAPPSNVLNLTVDVDLTDSTKINLSWPAVNDIDLRGYRLMEGSTILTSTPILDTRYTYTATSSRLYSFSVVAIDNSGNPSDIPVVKTINITTEPAQVAGFSVTPLDSDRSRLRMQWTANTESDISYYEIRLGSTWNTASVIATQLKATLFECTLSTAGSITYMIKAVNVAGKYSANAATITKQYTLTPNAPASGSIVQDISDRTWLVITWLPIADKDLSQYEIRLGTNWDTGTAITATKETTIRYKISSSGSYKIMVKSKNVAGYYSSALNLSIQASIEAMDVTGFAAVQSISDHSRVTLSWNQPSALDVAYFEIRKGTTWDTGIIVGKRVTGTYFDVIVTDETAQTYWIKAVNVGGVNSQNPASVMGIYNLNPSMPTNLSITQNPNDRSQLTITWDGIPELDLNEYQLKTGYTWETADFVIKTKELNTTYNPLVSGDYKFMLKAKNNSNFYSDEVFTHFYATLEPSDVTGFQASQNGESVLLTWTKVSDADVVGYEIREGSTFENGSVIQTGITMAMYQFAVDTEITRKFHVKAINRSGRYSQTEAMASVTISNLLPKNVISTYDEIALHSGTHSNTEFGLSSFNFSTLGGKFSDYPTTKFSDIGGASVLKLQSRTIVLGNWATDGNLDGWSYSAYTSVSVSSGTIKGTTQADPKLVSLSNLGIDGTKYRYLIVKAKVSSGADSGSNIYASTNTHTTIDGTINKSFATINDGAWHTYVLDMWSAVGGTYWKTETVKQVRVDLNNSAGISVEVDYVYLSQDDIDAITYESTGIYTCARKDMGSIITANIATIFQPSILFTAGTTATLQFRTSQDNTIWTDWTNFAPIQSTFRYADFRVLLATADPTKTPEVNALTIRVDVPDFQSRKTATVAVGGTDISYGHTYYQQAFPLPTAIGQGLKAELISYTLTSARVRVVNASNTDVGGQIILDYKGY